MTLCDGRLAFAALRPFSTTAVLVSALALGAGPASAGAQWSTTEAHYQVGRALSNRDHRAVAPGTQHILTLQHASGWSRGENFFFFDMSCCSGAGGADRDVYAEWYSSINLAQVSAGPVGGLALIGGINWGAQAKVVKLTPGARLVLDLPGFAFANLDYLYVVSRNAGLGSGGAPDEGNSHIVDFNWALPFAIGSASFSLEGHGEWQSSRDVEDGDGGWRKAPHWILLQPQLRWDLGKSVSGNADRIFVGTEFHVWLNKFGADGINEIIPQALVVFRF